MERDYKPAKSSEKAEAQKADKFNAVCIIRKKFIPSIGSNFIYLYVGALLHRCGCCRIYFDDNASGDYPSGGCNRGRFGAVRESQEEGYVIAVALIVAQICSRNFYLFYRLSFFFCSGYVRFLTNFGTLNLELHCDLVPKTCENFMKHCQNGYYDGTKFHRSIRNFMVSLLSTMTNI